jgi:uncharacterized Zn-finger protein
MDSNQKPISVKAHDLPLHCPTKATPLWNQHPKVFLDIDAKGWAKCPYCGAEYQVVGTHAHHH